MKRRTLALILAAALTVTSVEGTAVMASAAEFTSEAVEETEAELETAPEDSADVAVLSDQGIHLSRMRLKFLTANHRIAIAQKSRLMYSKRRRTVRMKRE